MSEARPLRKKRAADAIVIRRGEFMTDTVKSTATRGGRSDLDIAEQIYRLRREAKRSRRELTLRVGTTDTVISRLESPGSQRHYLAKLRRIAQALNRKIEVRFIPLDVDERT
ncbi:MAG: hypothetical protein KDD69_15455 [Bdellovibrionales bacterium]|nr:hypothetical protein [Bdellovibrionales bacterium]